MLGKKLGSIFLHDLDVYCLHIYTGCPDQIVRSVNLILLPNQKTCRKCKDRLKIEATKHTFG